MLRLIAVLVLAALVVLAALTAYGSIGGWVAGAVLAAAGAMGLVRRPPLAAAVAIVWIVMLGASLIPAVQNARGVAQTLSDACRVKQLLLAIHNYHAAHGVLPPAFVADDKGRPMHSWRTLLLPYMEQHGVYERYDFDEPWNGPNNRNLADEAVRPFRSAVLRDQPPTAATSFVAVVGPGTAWLGPRGLDFEEAGGPGRILLVETYAADIHWMEPRDLSVEEFVAELAPEPTFVDWWLKLPPPGWRYHHQSLGRHVGMANGDVHFVHGDLTTEAARGLVQVDVHSGPFLDALGGRKRLPAVMVDFPVTEHAVRWIGFLVLAACSAALLPIARGWKVPPRGV